MKLIIDIPEDWEKGIKNMYDWDIANFLYETCRNGTPIPDNATVCDIEQIRAEIEQIQGNEYEVSDTQGNRYKYETIEKAEVLQIIDKYR